MAVRLVDFLSGLAECEPGGAPEGRNPCLLLIAAARRRTPHRQGKLNVIDPVADPALDLRHHHPACAGPGLAGPEADAVVRITACVPARQRQAGIE